MNPLEEFFAWLASLFDGQADPAAPSAPADPAAPPVTSPPADAVSVSAGLLAVRSGSTVPPRTSSRTASTSHRHSFRAPASGQARIVVTIKSGKYRVKFDEDHWDGLPRKGKLAEVFKDGDIISREKGDKFLAGWGGVLGYRPRIKILQKTYPGGSLYIKEIHSHQIINSDYVDGLAVVTFDVPPGNDYYVYSTDRSWVEEKGISPGFHTGFWFFTSTGPHPFSPAQTLEYFNNKKCWNTLSNPIVRVYDGSARSSEFSVSAGQTKAVSLLPKQTLEIPHQKQTKNATSVAWSATCKIWGSTGGKIKDILT